MGADYSLKSLLTFPYIKILPEPTIRYCSLKSFRTFCYWLYLLELNGLMNFLPRPLFLVHPFEL